MNFRHLLPLCLVCMTGFAQSSPRARALGVPLDGNPGPLDAITDVKGVEVGDTTLIRGEGKLVVGQGPVRTGVRYPSVSQCFSLSAAGMRSRSTPGGSRKTEMEK
jgi:hypothetical protein